MAEAFGIIPDAGNTEVWEWATDVLTTWNGSESRLSLRSRPRVSLQGRVRVINEADRRDLLRLFARIMPSPNAVPLWGWSCNVAAAATAGDTIVELSGIEGASLAIADRLVLINPETELAQSAFISGITGNTVALATGLSANITPDWVAYKGMTGFLRTAPISWGSAAGELTVNFESFEDPVVQREGAAATITEFNGLPVLERVALDRAGEQPDYMRELLDSGLGARFIATRADHLNLNMSRSFRVDRQDAGDVDYWRLFLDTVRGAWKAFLISTQLSDLTPVGALTPGATSFLIEESAASTLFNQHASFQNIEITYADGSTSRHEITASVGSSVTISPALPNDAKVANLDRISYLVKVRASDRMRWRHDPLVSNLSFDLRTTDDG